MLLVWSNKKLNFQCIFCSLMIVLWVSSSSAEQSPAPVPIQTHPEKDKDIPIPEVPPENLPRVTGEKPDPAKEQFARGIVHIQIGELVIPREGDSINPEIPLIQNYLSEYFRRAGYVVVSELQKASFRMKGNFECEYSESLVFRGLRFGLKFKGSGSIKVLDSNSKVIDQLEIPSHFREGIIPGMANVPGNTGSIESNATEEAKSARALSEDTFVVRDLRREMSKIIWDHLFYKVEVFASPEIPKLIHSLSVEDLEAEKIVEAADVIKKLAAHRLKAVPYLIEALTDESPVLVAAKYPGLTAFNAEKLRVFHIADKALEEIFQKVSRMNLDTPDKHRFIIIKGWENEWKHFCPSFRASPENKRRN